MFSGHPAALKMPPAPDVGEDPWIWVGVATNTAFAGPWGVTYAANLTPDKATGLDSWKTADFAKAICTEKTRMWVTTCCRRRHGKTIREWLTAVDGGLRSMFAYLQGVPAISNPVPQYSPPAAPHRTG